jgi:hypothetical protein
MNAKNLCRLGWLFFGLAVCLAATACRTTCREEGGAGTTRAALSGSRSGGVTRGSEIEEAVLQKLRRIIIPELSFRPPATIIDALDFFKQASADYDDPAVPFERRGVSLVLKLPVSGSSQSMPGANEDPFAAAVTSTNGIPVIPALSARFISLYDAIQLVSDVTGMKFRIVRGCVMIVPKDEPDGELITRTYNVLTPMYERMSGPQDEVEDQQNGCGHAGASPFDPCQSKTFYEQMGVKWPSGSSITYLAAFGKLRVTNTRENLDRFEQVLRDLNVLPCLLDIEMQVVAFRQRDIDRLLAGGGVSMESLVELRKKGRVKLVSTARASTKSGQEVIVKAVREVLFPTELGTDCRACSNQTCGASVPGALVPRGFEMRDVGMTLQLVPEISAEGRTINIMLNPQWVTLDGWETYAAVGGRTHKTLPFRQPVFGVTSFQTQVTVEDSGTVLLGSVSTPDGEWVHVGFLTARLADVQSELSGERQ